MDGKFRDLVEMLHPSFTKLIEQNPVSDGRLPKPMPTSGIYLFSEGDKHLYIGRSRSLRRRFGLHTRPSSGTNSASFAYLLARETFGVEKPSYKNDATSRSALSVNSEFAEVFSAAKKRIRQMDYRCVEESDDTRQALLEIYCSVVLATPYNDFKTH